MFTTYKKRILILSIASLLLLALIVGPRFVSSARADYLTQSANENNLTIAYPGQLTGDDGRAVADGNYDFTFSLYDDAIAGNLLWSETQTGVTVRNGSFGVLLGSVNPLSEAAFTTKLWLSVSVRGPQTESFVELAPRQLLDEIPYSSPDSPSAVTGTCAHDHFFEKWVGSTTTYGFRVENTGTGDGIRGYSASTYASFGGIYGYNSATTGEGAGVSAYANSSTGYGVYAINNNGTAVYGSSENGYGVLGRSTNRFGVQARGFDDTGDDTMGDLWLDGARGEILTGERLNLASNWNVNVELDFDNNQDDGVFRIYANNVNTEVFSVDEAGDIVAMGTNSAKVETLNDGPRLLYAVESPEVWFEDIGSAALIDGATEVLIEPIFTQTVNLEDYQVFLTPVSDVPVILYVVAKSPASFIVMGVALDGKPVSCSFDYRIIAKRLGYEDVRLQRPVEPEGDIK